MTPLYVLFLSTLQDSDSLLRGLGAEDYETRESATAALIATGPGPILRRALAHADPEVRARARAVQIALEPPRVVVRGRQLLGILNSDDDGVINMPMRFHDPDAPPLEDRRCAHRVPPLGLSELLEQELVRECVLPWVRELGSESEDARESAMSRLRDCCWHVTPILAEAVASPDREIAFRVSQLLAERDREFREYYARELESYTLGGRLISEPRDPDSY